MSTSTLFDPHSLAELKGLSLRCQRVVDGLLQGLHRSPHHGSSVEFSEHKEYSPGDDVRHIDWKAYARLDKHYVKRFEHESNLTAWCLLDASGSMGYQGQGSGLTKLRMFAFSGEPFLCITQTARWRGFRILCGQFGRISFAGCAYRASQPTLLAAGEYQAERWNESSRNRSGCW